LTCSFTVNPEKPSTLISGLSSKKSLKMIIKEQK